MSGFINYSELKRLSNLKGKTDNPQMEQGKPYK